jgi:hypothetical protein
MQKAKRQRVVIVGEGLGMLNGLVAGVSHGGSDHVASSLLGRQSTLYLPQHPSPRLPSRQKMSVSLNPSSALGFRSASLCFWPFSSLMASCRTTDQPCQTLADDYEQQHPTGSIQGQDYRSKGAHQPLQLSFVRSLTVL